jgi:hypothetical protein
MFGVKKEDLVPALGRIQTALCAYGHPRYCDCKFGATRPCEQSEEGSGCPEVSQAAAIIATMTPEEFATFARRAGVRIG